jgi:uncharacterized protein YkwD
VETLAGGWRGSVQWFERRRMELHPENAPPYDVLLGLLGNELLSRLPDPPPAAAPAGEIATRALARTNQYRRQFGCPALTLDPALTQAAQAHSNDMARNDFFSHTGSDGAQPDQRLLRAGYRFTRMAENLAAGYDTPEAMVDALFNETPPNDGHRRNILDCALREMGLGYSFLADDGGNVAYNHYWTQDFGAR